MEPIYRMQVKIAPTDVDCFGRLKPSIMLLYIQSISELHSGALDYTYEELASRGIFWAVIRNRVRITRMPRTDEVITLESWPMPTTRVAYPRSTVAYDSQGNELFRSVCLWVLMDLKNRSMLLPGKSGVDVRGILRGGELEAPGSLIPRPHANIRRRPVCFTDLDRNGHFNNAKFLNWIDDLLPSQFHRDHPMKELPLVYINEAREGHNLDVSWDLDENGLLQVEFQREKADNPEDHDRIFAARIQFDNVVL